jgi:hypothetical protein
VYFILFFKKTNGSN